MADSEPTRVDKVEENIENIETAYGEGGFYQLAAQCLKDISVSLAMLVDKSGS